ncbi:MAG: hypothetical protein ABIX46_11955 [Burkholderiaceae bacterium]
MQRPRRHGLDALVVAAALGLMGAVAPVAAVTPAVGPAGQPAAVGPPDLRCEWSIAPGARAGGPVHLRFSVINPGRAAVRVLAWGTPFEGWRSPYVLLERDGVALPYRGASVKRGDPGLGDDLRLPASGRRQASVDLGQAYDLSRPGRYRLEARILLHDVHTGRRARPRSAHTPQPLACPALEFTLPG